MKEKEEISIKDVLITFPKTGICEVDIQKCVSIWDKKLWCISQWRDEYTLLKVMPSSSYGKCKISEIQAKELIEKLNLNSERSLLFASGSTWK